MKPFLLLVARPDSPIKADEVNSLLRYGALDEEKLVVVDLLQPLTNTPDFTQYSGVFISGSPYNYLTPLAQKSPEQVRVESQLLPLAKTLVDQDIPTLGLCYGLQILALAAGGTLTREFSEDMQPVRVSLTEAGRKDPGNGPAPGDLHRVCGTCRICWRAARKHGSVGILNGLSRATCPHQIQHLRNAASPGD